MIKFSVIVPLYNCEKYVAECIDSILTQKYTDFELIVVNDGSTDASRKVVESYKDSRIRIVDKENGGLLHARLTGLREAKNDYVIFVDADDKLRPNLLEVLVEYFSSGVDCVIYKLQEFTPLGKKEETRGIFPHKTIFEDTNRNELLKILLTSGIINSIVSKAFKKELISIDEMKEYPRIAIGEDGLFTLQLLKNYSKLVYLDCVYYDYRISSQSMTHKLRFSNFTDNVFRFNLYYKTANKYFKENLEETIYEIDRTFFTMIGATLISPRTCFDNKAEYCEIVKKISEDELFKEKIKSSLDKQNVFYKTVLKCVEKKSVGWLLFFRKLLKLVYKK